MKQSIKQLLSTSSTLFWFIALIAVCRFIFVTNADYLNTHPALWYVAVIGCAIATAVNSIVGIGKIPDMEREHDLTFKSITKVR